MTLIDRYDRVSPVWETAMQRHGFGAAYASLFEALALPRKQCVCDMGTGCGDFAAAFAASNGPVERLTLVDPSRRMLDIACDRLGGNARIVDRLEARLEETGRYPAFDLLLGAHVIEHCADPAAAIAALADMVRPGGHIVLSVSKPHLCQWLIWLRWGHRWFAPESVDNWLAAAGFVNLRRFEYPSGIPARVSMAYVAERASP
ncbi:class I SAM-dependent methyltransferase [Oricola sp.]|uniref:class I SAM-dependent methyltransferase n=1 Tax=Oricola sp. TaxID=1979950 RepID=UPI003BAD7417